LPRVRIALDRKAVIAPVRRRTFGSFELPPVSWTAIALR
jgi:hypothetical protein